MCFFFLRLYDDEPDEPKPCRKIIIFLLSTYPLLKISTMKLALISLLAGSAAAFAPAPTARTSVACNAGLDDLKSIAEKSNPVLKVSLYHHLCSFLNMLVPLFVQVHSPNILLFVELSSVLRSS